MPTPSLPDKLDTPQRRQASAAVDAILAAALATAPIGREACRAALHRAYAGRGLAAPEVRFVDSPMAAMRELQSSGPGREVEISFNDALNQATAELPRQPGWATITRLVDARLGHVAHYAHAVADALEAQVGPTNTRLLYWSGAECLWRSAEQLARVQVLATLGALQPAPPGLALGLSALSNCGWINAFEGLCLVSERPLALEQHGRPRGPEGLLSRATWRDGLTTEAVHRG